MFYVDVRASVCVGLYVCVFPQIQNNKRKGNVHTASVGCVYVRLVSIDIMEPEDHWSCKSSSDIWALCKYLVTSFYFAI